MANRTYWGQIKNTNLPDLNLVKIQRDSFEEFLENGIQEVLDEVSPIDDFTGKNYTLAFGKYSIGKAKHSPEEALKKGVTYDAPLKVEATVINKQTGLKIPRKYFYVICP